ncbi:transposase, partial [Streptomyces sp. NPDC005774]|uniref:transposase n=1 Tax=Streptomyces sp. NPDC005774 TaxID=3364728 RepID=UPI0036AE0C4C
GRLRRAKSFISRTAPFPEAVPTTNSLSRSGHNVCDNYATHKTPAIKKWLLAHPRFHLHFTPTGSSRLNLVERWFAELTNKQIRRGVHKSVQALEKDIRNWIAAWNTGPRPYIWTKTADEILERLASYLNRIPGSEHWIRGLR